MATGKKPPIKLKDLGEGTGESKAPGEISYARKNQGNGKNKRPQVILLAAVALIFILVIAIGYTGKQSIEALDGNVQELNTRVDEEVTRLGDKVDTALVEARSAKTSLEGYAKESDIPSLEGYVKEEDIEGYVKEEDLPDFGSYVEEEELEDYAELKELEEEVGRIAYEIALLRERIRQLEGG